MAKNITIGTGYDDPCLCENHAAALRCKPGTYTEAQESDDPEDPVQCDECAMAIMRRAGAL